MSKKLSLMVVCAALMGLAGCNESGHWLECSAEQEGQQFCVNGVVSICAYNNHNHNDKKDGYFFAPVINSDGSTTSCEPEEAPKACNDPGLTRCINGKLQTCGNDGNWGNEQTCAENYKCGYDSSTGKNACIFMPTCENGSVRCSEDANKPGLQTCVNGVWSEPSCDADKVCRPIKTTDGNDSFACTECDPSDTTHVCSDDKKFVKVCNAQGNWAAEACNDSEDLVKICQTTDKDGNTVNAQCLGECIPSSDPDTTPSPTRCNKDDNDDEFVEFCDDNHFFKKKESCAEPQYCEQNENEPAVCAGECIPGQVKCSIESDKQSVLECNDKHVFVEKEVCDAAAFKICVEQKEEETIVSAVCQGECDPGSSQCYADDENKLLVQTCADDHFWNDPEPESELNCSAPMVCSDTVDNGKKLAVCIYSNPCDNSNFKAECNADGTITQCVVDGLGASTYHVENYKCTDIDSTNCPDGACVCDVVTDAAECVPTYVGRPCVCDGVRGQCFWNLDGNEVRSMISNNRHLTPVKEAINPLDEDHPGADIPNIFASNYIHSPSSTDDSNITDITVPNGMVVGCYPETWGGINTINPEKSDPNNHSILFSQLMDISKVSAVINDIVGDYKISIIKQKGEELGFENNTNINLDDLYSSLTAEQKQEIDNAVDKYAKENLGFTIESLIKTAEDVANTFLQNITFNAPKGYLLYGAMAADDFSVDNGNAFGYRFLSDDKIKKINSQAKMINAGNYETAKSATCPAGTTLVDYAIGSRNVNGTDLLANGVINTALCLRKCYGPDDTNSCPAGYQCVALPKSFANTSNGLTTDIDLKLDPSNEDKVNICADDSALTQFRAIYDLSKELNKAE